MYTVYTYSNPKAVTLFCHMLKIFILKLSFDKNDTKMYQIILEDYIFYIYNISINIKSGMS